jgi:hypothetical protein
MPNANIDDKGLCSNYIQVLVAKVASLRNNLNNYKWLTAHENAQRHRQLSVTV